MDRLFTEADLDRLDDLGFLDLSRTPRLQPTRALLADPLTWVLGPPWIGKTTVGRDIDEWLRTHPDALGGVEGRHCLTCLDIPGADRDIPPKWWAQWCNDSPPRPAVWLIDALDEALGASEFLLDLILRAIDGAPAGHLPELRLVLFSRPHAELAGFAEKLYGPFLGICHRGESFRFWLARLHREAAERLVGAEHFAHVKEVIQRNDLQRVAGYPVVLKYLAWYSETAKLCVCDVWRGILTSLLGEPQTNPRARFDSEIEERFDAACRIAALLSLTRGDSIRGDSPDRTMATIRTLFQHPKNRLRAAAGDACRTAAMVALPEQGAFRFAQRNVQDWLTAFALERLPLPNLRSTLASPNGELTARLRETARLIRTITERPDVRAEIDRLSGGILLPSDAAPPTLAEAIRCLDQLEEVTGKTPLGLRLWYERNEELARLQVEGLGSELGKRLQDPARHREVKQLLLDVAEATQAIEVVEAAVAVVLDATQHDEVRYGAMRLVIRFGGEAHLRALEEPIARAHGDSAIEHRVSAMLIFEFLNRGLWEPWRAAVHAPPADSDVVDTRWLLLHHLAEHLTTEDARQLMPYSLDLYKRHADDDRPERLPQLLERAINLVTQQPSPDAADIGHLCRFVLELANSESGPSTAWAVATRLRPFIAARRRFYEHDIQAIRNGQDDRRIAAFWLLMPDDWRWLRDQALGPWAEVRVVWDHAYWMARTARGEGHLADAEWQEFVSLVEEHAPGLPTDFEEGARQRELERQKEEAERKERDERDPTSRPLAERVTRLVEYVGLADVDRMRNLGYLCFAGVVGLDAQARGEWEELPAELQHRVLDMCRSGLEHGEPTPIPAENSFPGSILGEGASFSQVVLSRDSSGWLTDRMIRKWLPTALFARMSGGWSQLTRACWAVCPAATESVLIVAIEHHGRRYGRPHQLRMIPSECWTDPMTDRVVGLLQDDAIPPVGRRELLEQLVTRSPERAYEIAHEWAMRPVTSEDTDQLRQGGRNVLLLNEPRAAFDLIEPDFRARGTAALEELSALWASRDELHVRWGDWPLALLGRLGRLLLAAYPRANDPEFHGGFVTPDRELREIRDGVMTLLLQRSDTEGKAIVDGLAELDPSVRAWEASHRAAEQAGRLVSTFDPQASCDPAAFSVAEAVKLLDRAGYRLIRSADDLLEAVMEALRQVNEDVGHDVSMLYEARRRPSKGTCRKRNREDVREHLHEDALQAYLRRRLHDLLRRMADNVDVELPREEKVAFRRKFDLRVMVPCHGTRQIANVVFEVKWSDNDETRTGLVQQLGERYLRAEGLTHGVFLVGWCGKWRPGGRARASSDRCRLEQYLTDQRDHYCRVGSPGACLRIEPYVLDVRWSRTTEAPGDASPAHP